MKSAFLYIVVMMMILSTPKLMAQLSPGDLTTAHADLEGISNCTKCHTIGQKVSNDKCLACHDEIESLINQRQGYHASREVRGKDCSECHSEHHGRRFDMVRFDEDNFNHNLTGYELTGAHQRIDCRQCHKPDFIEDRDIKKRNNTYLGLEQTCISCHEDYHQNTLSQKCNNCHVTESFAPARKFDHSDADFVLVGKHQEVDCIECHQKELRNGKEFQVFTGVTHSNCNSCHDDVHNNNLGSNCQQCHSEESFNSLSQINRFNHNRTNFPLKGSHQRINCSACHNMNASLTSIFQDNIGVATNECNSCHEDVHDNRFGTNCAECHNEKSFRQVNTDNFNHGLTDFALVGQHATVDCRKCHTESLTEPLPHNQCASCHDDYHDGQFTSDSQVRDCAECHNEEGFEITLYTLEDHQESAFPLEGAHLATPCFACHVSDEKWEFRNIGEQCVDCHEDVHADYIDAQYYPDQSCVVCHVTDSWSENHFDHSLTDFRLEGAHAEQECMSCHRVDDKDHQNKYEGFVNLSNACASCHENVHRQQFEKNGGTDCARCHGFNNWGIADFDHNKTAFKLEGRHAEIACEACHKPIEVEGEIITQYKFESFECIDCHQ